MNVVKNSFLLLNRMPYFSIFGITAIFRIHSAAYTGNILEFMSKHNNINIQTSNYRRLIGFKIIELILKSVVTPYIIVKHSIFYLFQLKIISLMVRRSTSNNMIILCTTLED